MSSNLSMERAVGT